MTRSTLRRNTLVGLGASLILAALKFAAGIAGHSSALVADACESAADSVGSIIVWQGIRVSQRPPDEDHPYGHGKAEALAALAVGTLLLLAAAWIVVRASHDLAVPHAAPAAWTLVVLIAVIATKEALFRLILRGAQHEVSTAAVADAWHHRSDAITSAVAFVGVAIAIWGPRALGVPDLVLADEVAAILASGIMVLTASRLVRPSLQELLDAEVPRLGAEVSRIASEVPGVRLVEKVFVRKSGSTHHVDMHLHVAPDLPIRDAHALAGKVKAIVRERVPGIGHVLIHVEPDERAT
ncbi:MAG: cation transporter [Phycisphaerales bacterium]|nr:cation transporter [Phycisphaerales bacterium]